MNSQRTVNQMSVLLIVYLCGVCLIAAGPATADSPCSRKMEERAPILYKLCLYYTHETGIENLDHEDDKWIEDAKNLLLQNSNDPSSKREEPRVHHMFIRFGKRR